MSELGFPKEEVGILQQLELTKPKLPEVFDYDASVIRFQDIRRKTGEGFKGMIEELWIARECLAVRTGRPRKVKSEGAKTRSWMEYLDAIGLARSTVHVWLTNAFPDKERQIKLPQKRLPSKSSKPERVMTPAEAADGMADRALGETINKPEWGGGKADEETAPASDPIDPEASGILRQLKSYFINIRVRAVALMDKEAGRELQKLAAQGFQIINQLEGGKADGTVGTGTDGHTDGPSTPEGVSAEGTAGSEPGDAAGSAGQGSA